MKVAYLCDPATVFGFCLRENQQKGGEETRKVKTAKQEKIGLR
jgi:hypothetical protein